MTLLAKHRAKTCAKSAETLYRWLHGKKPRYRFDSRVSLFKCWRQKKCDSVRKAGFFCYDCNSIFAMQSNKAHQLLHRYALFYPNRNHHETKGRV